MFTVRIAIQIVEDDNSCANSESQFRSTISLPSRQLHAVVLSGSGHVQPAPSNSFNHKTGCIRPHWLVDFQISMLM